MTEDLPLILDAEGAIALLKKNECNDAVKSYAIGIMSKDGYSNAMIRKAIGIDKTYTVTHYIRAGTKLSEEQLAQWNRNIQEVAAGKSGSHPITLGHVRFLAKFEDSFKQELLNDIETGIKERLGQKPRKVSIVDLKILAEKKDPRSKSDIKVLEEKISQKMGREVSIHFNKKTQNGSVKLSYFDLKDLDVLIKILGVKLEDD